MKDESIERSLGALIERQLEAYNRRDIEAFLATYAPDATLHRYPDQLVAHGHAQLRERYAQRFASAPELHAQVPRRIVASPYVIDEERVTGLPGGATLHVVVIYEIRDGFIVDARAMTLTETGNRS